MTPTALLTELEREPFEPIRLRLSDGRAIDITNPGTAFISNMSVYIFTVNRGSRYMADVSHLISLRHIVSIEPADGSGKAKSRKKPS